MAQFYPPLKERVIKAKSVGCTVVNTSIATTSRGVYKDWDEDRMVRAVDSVLKKKASIRKAGEMYGIPKSTIADRISGRVMEGARSGPLRYLNTQQEEELVHFLLECASIGYPKSRQEVIGMVQRLLSDCGIEKTVTHGWWESFCHRHPNVALRATASLSLSRAKASDTTVINKYYDLLESTMDLYDLRDKPCQLFNVDDTGMPLNPKPLKMVCGTGSKNPASICSGNKSQITIVGCVNAAGYCIPPMVIYGRKAISAALVENEIPGTIYGLSSKGWIDQDLFDQWFDHFLCYTPSTRPLLLLMDGHSAHYCPSVIHRASENEVVLMALPPNTTHLTQPLDKGIYGPLKVEWRKVCYDYIVQNPGKLITLYNFSPLFSKAWMKSMTIINIMAGFSTTGIFLTDRNKVISKLEASMCTPTKQPNKLSYLPLLTPVPSPPRKTSSKKCIVFSELEIQLFLERHEEGYDGGDERYKIWLETYHPGAETISNVSLNQSVFHTPKQERKTKEYTQIAVVSKPASRIDKLFSKPELPSKLPTKTEKSCGRVLTSSEALKLLQEKEEKKDVAKQKKDAAKQKKDAVKQKKDAVKQKKELCQKNAEKKVQKQVDENVGIVEEGSKRKDNPGNIIM